MNAVNNLQSGIMQQKPVELSAHIDWISVTVPHGAMREIEHGVVLLEDFLQPYQLTRGSMGYASARKYASGAVVQWHDEHPKMGVHVTYSAQALEHAATNFKLSQYEILKNLSEFGRVTRLDICVDVDNVPINIHQLYEDCRTGAVVTRAQSFNYVESAKSGNEIGAATTYVGSMTKRKKLLRIYNKGLQLNLDHYKTRFELEVHGQPANSASKMLMDSENMADEIRAMIAGYADLSFTEAGKYVSSNKKVKLSHPQYKKSDTANWLVNVVAKTLANETYADYNLLEEFMKSYQYHYSQIIHKEKYHGD